jgi:sulfonate transport system permease protein
VDAKIATEPGLISVLEPNFERIGATYPAMERAWTMKDRAGWGRFRTWAFPLGAPLVLLGAWQLGAQWSQSNLLPPPSVVLGTLSDMLRDGSLLGDLAVSFRRVALGWVWGAGSGALLGLTLDALNQVPIYAYLPLIIVLLGLGELGKVTFIAAGSFYPMLVNAREGARGVDPKHLEVAAVYGYSRPQAFWRVLLPEASPFLLSGARISLGIAWMLVVGAELFGASSGIGYLITWSRQLFQTDGVIVGILAVSATGWALDQGLKALESRLLAWKKDHGNAWA